MRALALVALVACGGGTQPAPMRFAPPPTMSFPAPKIAWNAAEHRYAASGLPAVAADGSFVVLAVTDADGGRGYPNLRLETRDRSDLAVTTSVFTSSEWEELAPSGDPGAPLKERIDAANARLAAWNRERQLAPMTALDVVKDANMAGGEGIRVEWTDRKRLIVAATNAGPAASPLGYADGRRWTAMTESRCASENTDYLAAAFATPDLHVVLVAIGYHGTDLCWEPPAQWHVISW